MSKILIMLSLMTSNAFANNSETIKMSQPHTLTLDDVRFDASTGTIKKYTADYKDIVIPDNFDGVSVTSIGDWTFAENALTSVSIPNSVTKIGDMAFHENALTSVSIPNSVTSIGSQAFSDNALTSVTIPNSVTEIGYGAFFSNALTSVSIPNSVTEIEGLAFTENALTSVSIPNSVTEIGDGAFAGNALTSVSIPNSVTSIGEWAFAHNQLTSVSIPNSVTYVGNWAFFWDDSANNVPTIDNSSEYQPHILTLDDVEFNHSTGTIVRYMANYTYIVIPEVLGGTFVTAIGAEAFVKYTYDSEHDEYYDHTGEVRGSCLSDRFEFERYGWPFVENEQLQSVTIPNSVTSIGDYAFANNDLTEEDVIIPESVILGDSVFCEFNVFE